MPGQLWQECRRRGCDTEPVCLDCEYCSRHCTCARDAEDNRQAAEFVKANPGFMNEVLRHHEQGAQEHDGETFEEAIRAAAEATRKRQREQER